MTAILFDLDGTLLDTAPDLVGALNRMRIEDGLPALDYASLRPAASHGTDALLAAGYGSTRHDAGHAALRERYLAQYRARIAERTAPFPGMDDTLATLEARGIAWGIVTNKPSALTGALLAALGLDARACAVVSGDTLAVQKPDPAPLLHACTLAGLDPARCWYVGDAARDIEAGSRAGMRTLVAGWGYLGPDDEPAAWGADGTLAVPTELLDWLDHGPEAAHD
ncbi:MAG TPA: HAD-IA family hydrolase [Plasticicumulans sp.]|uniref:HAD family hydrolase n=1 Tax=Plasticicumulans sp. TaxID=2307179 RepID=UPI002C5A94BA|nr:HAD-IA family hydrolase [Plasticicumulans sp.]HMW29721.1 HAD-IA family hydrolase [Plasticicumulans sp.]HNG49850.1 HAD-IA family hydrolase [Plasticicumulans sp.]HNI22093.1 HAD-IA family hydrolase [Plasticicumulans sp.]